MREEDKEIAYAEIELLLGEALGRVQNRGNPLAMSATGNRVQSAGMFWRLAASIRALAIMDSEEILMTPAGENGCRDLREAIEGLGKNV